MTSMLRTWLSGTLIAGLSVFVGCGDGGPGTASVEGTVSVGGKPLDKIMVEFWPDAGGPRSIGETDAQGNYKLTTDDGKTQGAVVGSHKIVLRDSGALGDKFLGREGESVDMSKGKKSRIPAKYGAAESTPLVKSVEAGKTNKLDLEVK